MVLEVLSANPDRQSGWTYLIVLGGLALVVLLMGLLNRLIIHFFPSAKNSYTTGGNVLMRVEAVFLPGRDHVMEAIEREDVEEDEEGDPTDTGKGCPYGVAANRQMPSKTH